MAITEIIDVLKKFRFNANIDIIFGRKSNFGVQIEKKSPRSVSGFFKGEIRSQN